MNDFDGLLRGLAFCRAKTVKLDAQARDFAAANIKFRVQGVPSESAFYFARLEQEIPDDLVREVGAITNELMAQLDHLANILGRRHGANSDQASFPIVSENWNAGARRKIRSLSPDDQARIEMLQPYQHDMTGELVNLQHANNCHKHRRPLAFQVAARISVLSSSYKIGAMMAGDDMLTEPQTEVMHHVVEGTNAAIEQRAILTFNEPSEIQRVEVFKLLEASANAIEGVILEFKQ